MKKSYLAIVSAITLLLGSTVSISPASAFVFPFEMMTLPLTAGDEVVIDMGCQEANIVDVHFDSGSLPPGLTMDAAGLITGTPTTPGDYTLNGYSCSYNGGSNTGSWPNYYVTFQVNAAFTPVPTLIAHSLNTQECSIYVGVIFPVTTDVGTAFVEISNSSGTVVRSNSSVSDPLPANQLFARTYTVTELNESANHFNPLDSTTSTVVEPFACGDTLTINAGYQYRSAPVATQTVDNLIINQPAQPGPTQGSEPSLRVIPLNNAECEFRVVGSLPSTPLPGTTQLKIYSGDQSVALNNATLTLTDFVANTFFDFTFSADAIEDSVAAQPAIVASEYNFSSNGDFCGTYMFVHLDYTDLLYNYWTTALNGVGVVYPTRPDASQTSEYSISATQVEGACNIRVVAKAPNEARPIAIVISELEAVDPELGLDWISGIIVNEPVSDGGFITANLSFASKDAITASIPVLDEDKIFIEPREGIGSFLAVIDSPEGALASTLITLGKLMPTCNAGSTLDTENFRCLPVERGYYSTELNSITAIPCPKGMTTASPASKSINDCYKPLAQSVTGLKAPKALKYGASTNLAITTNTKALAKYKVTGPCTAKVANVTTKVKGKKVTSKMLKVTASKKSGTCSVTLTSAAKDKYLAMSQPLKIKVSKTGK